MSTRNTAIQGAPFPDVNEPLNNVNDWIYNLATFQEVRGIQRYSTQAALVTARPTPSAGEVAWVTADNVLQAYNGSAWVRVYPSSPMVYSGTTVPASTLGTVGDFYIKTA